MLCESENPDAEPNLDGINFFRALSQVSHNVKRLNCYKHDRRKMLKNTLVDNVFT